MKVLLTGATGFVEKQFLTLLETTSHEIFCLVRTSKGFANEYIWDFKTDLPKNLPVCDVIIHLAAFVDFSVDFNSDIYEVNTGSTIKLAKYAQSQNIRFILASMIGVHGNSSFLSPKTSIKLENNYATSKYLAEEVVLTFKGFIDLHENHFFR